MLLLLWVLVLTACGSDSDPLPEPDPGVENPPVNEGDGIVNVYKEGTGGYEVYRIPAIVRTKKGTLLAFAEARKKKSSGDSGDIDLVVRRSSDNGKTWGTQIMVWDQGANTCGNPVPIVDEETGRIHLLTTWNNGEDNWSKLTSGTGVDTRRAYSCFSDDDGLTWSAPTEITQSVKRPWWNWYGTGPVHGIRLARGTRKNRLVAPCYYTVLEGGQRKDYAHVIYSDDNGQSWTAGDTTRTGQVGECTVAELSDGRLMLNLRTGAGTYRKYCVSDNAGESWGEMKTDYTLLDPKCQGSLFSVQMNGQHTLFFSNAASAERNNLTVRLSVNDGASWTKKVSVHEGPAAYSDLVQTTDGKIGVLYEGGTGRPYENILFRSLSPVDFK